MRSQMEKRAINWKKGWVFRKLRIRAKGTILIRSIEKAVFRRKTKKKLMIDLTNRLTPLLIS